MKKKIWVLLVLAINMVLAGCADAEASEMMSVTEIPIEKDVAVESTGAINESDKEVQQVEEEEKEPYEDLNIEVKGNKGTITVGTTGVPFTEILTQAKILLAQEGWDLQIIKYEEYMKLNEDVLNGTLDAHLFAHQTYVDSYNDVNLSNLTTIDAVCYEMYGIFSKINQDLTNISKGIVVGIPEDATTKARALLYMQDLNWIVLKEDVGMTAIVDDIVENTKDMKFVEYNPDTLDAVLEEADYCIIGADQAIIAGFDMEEDVLAKESSMSEGSRIFASILAAKEDMAESDKMRALKKVLNSDDMKNYMEETYKGAYAIMK